MSAVVSETYEFSVGSHPELEVRNRAGNVSITAGAAGQVRVVVTKRARGLFCSASEADLERLHVAVEQVGDTVRIDAERVGSWDWLKHVSIDLEITAPPTVDLDLRMNAGNTRVSGLSGAVRAEVNAGNLDLIDVTVGGSSRLTLNAGNLTVRGDYAEGATLEANVNAGGARFALPAEAGVAVEGHATAGSIQTSSDAIQVSRHFASASASGTVGGARRARLRAEVHAGTLTFDVA